MDSLWMHRLIQVIQKILLMQLSQNSNCWKIFLCYTRLAMANAPLSSQEPGYCLVHLKIKEASYKSEILSHVEIPFCGTKPSLKLYELMMANIPELALFANLTPDC